jgi:hypothetical protein
VLLETKDELRLLGSRRSEVIEYKAYLAHLSLDYYEICKAAINRHYEGPYFHRTVVSSFSVQSPATLTRLRAVVQYLNTNFNDKVRQSGHKYQITILDNNLAKLTATSSDERDSKTPQPVPMSRPQALR